MESLHAMPRQRRAINTRWFKEVLRERQMSQAKLADEMDLDPSAISLAFRGERDIRADEAAEMARILRVPLEDVLRNAGIQLKEDGTRTKVPVVGWIDGKLAIHFGRPKGAQKVQAPEDLAGLVCVRYQTSETRLEAFDGVLSYFVPRSDVSAEAIGRWCVVEFAKGGWALRVVRRGYQRGAYNLSTVLTTGDKNSEEDVWLKSASPVLWLKF